MRVTIGQTLLLFAVFIEDLAIRIGGPVVAADYLREHGRLP